ncbi:MAG: TolC family protein [Bacteroidales bacterium]|nr:TolC family protein [Bacteroidales bacterium]
MKKKTRIVRALFLSFAILGGNCSIAQQSDLYTTQSVEQTGDVLRLDLQTALKIAHDNNPTLEIADLEIQRVDYAKKETLGNLLPSVSATGQYTNNIMKSVMFMPASMSAMMGGASYMEIGYKNSYSGTVSAQMPLVNFALWESIKAKQTDIDLIMESARSSSLDMTKQVKDAYYGVLLANASLKVLEQSINNAKEVLKSTKVAYEQGVSSEYDYLRAQVQVNNLNPTYINAKNGVELAALQLKMLLSLPESLQIEITEDLSSYEDNFSLLDSFEADKALTNNTELRQLDLNIANLQHNLKMIKYQHLPSLAAFGQYVYQTQAEDFKFKDYNWVSSALVGLTLNIPIFNGNTIINQQRQVELALKELQLQRNYVNDGMNIQVLSALKSMNAAKEQLLVNKEAIAQAERGYEIAKVRYQTGSGTILELNDSELALTQSKLNYQQAIYDYLSAQANYEKVMGR